MDSADGRNNGETRSDSDGAMEATLRRELKRRFDYDAFLPGQLETMLQVMSGGHAVLLAPTGNGKSLCYQLPALLKPGLTLVVSPLIALMRDQINALRDRRIEAEVLNSQLDFAEKQRVKARVESGRTKLLYIAPEGLIDNQGIRETLRRIDVSLLAIDEAHCISDWGHEFRPNYRRLMEIRNDIPDTPVIALTATATKRTLNDIVDQLRLSDGHSKVIRVALDRPNLRYEIRDPGGQKAAIGKLVDEIKALDGQSAIVYCLTTKETQKVASELRAEGIAADYYHGKMGEDEDRDAKQAEFMSGKTQVIVATNAFGMGVDKGDVRLVAHWGLARSIEAYYQETGRAGRDGKPARALLLFLNGSINKAIYLANESEDALLKARELARVDQIADLCGTTGCRRKMMLEYFGESPASECDGCDNCYADWEEEDVTRIWQMLATTIVQTNERFGMNYIVDLVRGSTRDSRIESNRHDDLPTFGSLRRQPRNHLQDVMRRLLDSGHLERYGDHRSIRLTQLGRRKLQAEEQVKLRRRIEASTSSAGSLPASTPKSKPTTNIGDVDPQLFERLRELRLKIAREIGKPAFVVFPDTTLRNIAASAPTSLEALGRVSGVGPWKLQEFGERFVATTMAYVAEHEGKPPAVKVVESAKVASDPSTNAQDASDLLRNVAETIDATGGIYELHWIVSILQGLNMELLAVKGHTQLRTFGIEKSRDHNELRHQIWQFIDLGYIARRSDRSGALEVTELGRRIID